LHGFWRTLPSFNPFTASSEPGQDLAGAARALIEKRGMRRDDEDGEAVHLPESHTPNVGVEAGLDIVRGFVYFALRLLTFNLG